MQALRFTNGKLGVERVPEPFDDREALVRVLKSGICNTDLEIARGYAGFHGTLGHEFVGVVERAADAPHLVGKRVVGEINAGCGNCADCRIGDSRHCPQRTVLGIVGRDGAHAEYLQLPARNLIEVPENVSDEEAVFVEPLAAACRIAEQVPIGPSTKVAIIGDGKLGLLCAMTTTLSSENVLLVGKHSEKLAIAGEVGVESILLDRLSESRHRTFDVVIEASGSESGFATALDLVEPSGKIVLKSTFHGTPTWAAAKVVVAEITIIGSRCGRFAPALELLAGAKVNVERLISDDLPLSRGVEAMERAGKGGILKVVLTP